MPLRSENTPSLACVSIIATTSICCAPLFWLHIALHFNFSYGWSGVRNGAGCTVWKSFETINKITKIIWFIRINGQFKKTWKITIWWIALSGLRTTSPPVVVPYQPRPWRFDWLWCCVTRVREDTRGGKGKILKEASASRSEQRTSIPARVSRNQLAHQSARDEAGAR